MRLHLLSDLHTEFESFQIPQVGADVVILGGDTAPGEEGLRIALEQLPDVPVLYLLGNHEFYGENVETLIPRLRGKAAGTNVRIMENDVVELAGVRFLGCTLWTDFALFEPRVPMEEAMWVCATMMNDYRRIRTGQAYRRLAPADTLALHRRSLRWLDERLAEPFRGPTVVLTHHAPWAQSLNPTRQSDALATAYASDLSQFIKDRRIDLWVHGHTHQCVDDSIGVTRIISNQRGYPDEPAIGFRPELTIEV